MATYIRHVEESLNLKLKDEQPDILTCLVQKRDCITVLPTGFGKFLPYQIYPFFPKGDGGSRETHRVLSPAIFNEGSGQASK